MAIVSSAVATQRRAITGSRKGVREAVAVHLASGLVLTYGEPYPDPDARPDQPGRVRVDLVLMVAEAAAERVISGELVPVRPITTARPPVVTTPARRRKLARTRAAYRRVRSVDRSTVATVASATAITLATGAVVAVVVELVRLAFELYRWCAHHGPELLGAVVVVLLLLSLLTWVARGCPTCGR